jgi:hypothetical protein
LTEDHIPPKSLFGKPLPDDFVKAPSCVNCNLGASKDDEYFKIVLALKRGAGDHPEASAVVGSVLRGLARQRPFSRRFFEGVREVPRMTPAGLYAGRGLAYDVNLQRLDRVVGRVVRALYWENHDHVRLPDECDVSVWSEEGLRGLGLPEAAQLKATILQPVLRNPAREIGRGALRYWFAAGDRPHLTAWMLEFYADVRFLAFTIPRTAEAVV